jgi:hypothetical protein
MWVSELAMLFSVSRGPRRWFMLPVHRCPRIEPHDANPEVLCLSGRHMRAQNPHHPLGEQRLGQVGIGSATLRQDGAGNGTFTEPADEVYFPNCLAKPTEDGSGRRFRKPVGVLSAKSDKHEEEGTA